MKTKPKSVSKLKKVVLSTPFGVFTKGEPASLKGAKTLTLPPLVHIRSIEVGQCLAGKLLEVTDVGSVYGYKRKDPLIVIEQHGRKTSVEVNRWIVKRLKPELVGRLIGITALSEKQGKNGYRSVCYDIKVK